MKRLKSLIVFLALAAAAVAQTGPGVFEPWMGQYDGSQALYYVNPPDSSVVGYAWTADANPHVLVAATYLYSIPGTRSLWKLPWVQGTWHKAATFSEAVIADLAQFQSYTHANQQALRLSYQRAIEVQASIIPSTSDPVANQLLLNSRNWINSLGGNYGPDPWFNVRFFVPNNPYDGPSLVAIRDFLLF
mgnify:CR=1 FL=1